MYEYCIKKMFAFSLNLYLALIKKNYQRMSTKHTAYKKIIINKNARENI